MPIPEFTIIVRDAIRQYQRRSSEIVGRDAQKVLVRHAARQIDEIDRRLESGELSRDDLIAGIVELLREAGRARRRGFQKRDFDGGRLRFGVPGSGPPISEADIERAMAKNCPVFPYCPDSDKCPH